MSETRINIAYLIKQKKRWPQGISGNLGRYETDLCNYQAVRLIALKDGSLTKLCQDVDYYC